MERRYDWVVKFKELEYKYYRLAQGVQPKPDEPTVGSEFYIENIDVVPGVFSITKKGTPTNTPNIEVKVNNSNWMPYNIVEGGTTEITVPVGGKIYLRGDNSYINNSNTKYYMIRFTTKHNIGGYLTSLLQKEGFAEVTSYNKENIFNYLFNKDLTLVNAKDLILQATTLTSRCYSSMFSECKELVTAPKLPATTLTTQCYSSMFRWCTSLITAPKLPATKLANNCYMYMLSGCTSLESVTALFETYIEGACSNWLSGVSETGTFYKKTGVEIPSGVSGIPEGWTVVEV